MNCFTPESLPVINGLAKAYAVCDHWYSSVPTQTFPNRSFVHAATSSGYVTNFWKTGPHEWDIGYLLNKTPTIYNSFQRRESIGGFTTAGLTTVQCPDDPEKALAVRAARSTLLSFAHILRGRKRTEICRHILSSNPTCCAAESTGRRTTCIPRLRSLTPAAATNALYGDELIFTIYEALRKSPDWDSTLLDHYVRRAWRNLRPRADASAARRNRRTAS